MENVNPLDINRIKNALNIEIRKIQPIKTENFMVRVYNVNDFNIVVIDNVTNDVYELMG